MNDTTDEALKDQISLAIKRYTLLSDGGIEQHGTGGLVLFSDVVKLVRGIVSKRHREDQKWIGKIVSDAFLTSKRATFDKQGRYMSRIDELEQQLNYEREMRCDAEARVGRKGWFRRR